MRKFFREFKEFISRGNVLDLAVAVIIGSAFTAIVTAFTSKIITPLINWVIMLICGGQDGLSSAYTILSAGYTDGELDLTKSIYIDWGAFISAVVNFILVALVLFLIIKAFNYSHRRIDALKKDIATSSKKERKAEIRAMKQEAKERHVKYKVVVAEHEAEKARLEAEAQKQKEEEEKQKALEEEKKAHVQEDLLREIRDLLKEKKAK